MRDKRPVDELSIEELERILAIRKREARQERLRHFGDQGRRLPTGASQDLSPGTPVPPQQHEAAENLPPVEPPLTYDITDDVPRFEDDLDEDDERPRKRQPPVSSRNGHNTVPLRVPRRRAGWDKMLLGVEMLAVTGIAAVLVVGGNFLISENKKIDELEQKSAAIQQEAEAMRPTLTPAPELRIQLADYVLPGGHYSPVDTGGSPAFNLDELPESVRPAAQAQLLAGPPVEFATPMPISAARVEINTPKVQVNGSIYGGDDWYALQKGVGHLAGSANPGERGNVVLTAHNDIYGEIFRDIQYLEPGDEVDLYDQMGRRYRYVVYDKQIVKPSDVWVLQRGNEPIVTLITCHPYRVDNRRMVVFARLQEG